MIEELSLPLDKIDIILLGDFAPLEEQRNRFRKYEELHTGTLVEPNVIKLLSGFKGKLYLLPSVILSFSKVV